MEESKAEEMLSKENKRAKKGCQKPAFGFGSSQPRFQTHGIPEMESFTANLVHLGPATYDVTAALRKRPQHVTDWTKGLNGKDNKEKNLEILGPNTHVIRGSLQIMLEKSHNRKNDFGFGTSPRMDEGKKRWSVPPPNIYDSRVCSPLKESWRSKLPTFTRDNCMKRFKDTVRPWSLPSTRYGIYKNINAPRISEFVQKRVSFRGPYDISSGPRFICAVDDSTNWPGNMPDFFEEFKRPRRANYGKWRTPEKVSLYTGSRLECTQLRSFQHRPEDPGPGHYNPKPTYTIHPKSREGLLAFMSGVKELRPTVHHSIFPAPGRYFYHRRKSKRDYIKHSYKSVFKSKTKRKGLETSENYLAW